MTVRHLGSAAFSDSGDPRRHACPHCAFWSYSEDKTVGHLLETHCNRRLRDVNPNPGRRLSDRRSPWVRNALANTLPPGGALPPRN